ncbi:MAG: glycosyltransferase [Phycisphaerae bacterium]|nr:MAG: glycosyltransferase [Planctomycetota bacterium]KAB2936949.1 MAG: glycosyltransferase family 4 protein [Phycisphaerae bacterium]MBE7456760.1 glycosyltransferase [Planctomycetia bacterium]MCK6464209.1 glycosyltransferase [Phycisphaerae bacterium]MCL4717800.1 glycosyltransferase [Phycisphaerae bacterium]
MKRQVADGAAGSEACPNLAGQRPVPPAGAESGVGVRVRGWLLRRVLRAALLVYLGCVSVLSRAVRRKARVDGRVRVLVTGKFPSNTWVGAFLRPMAAVGRCEGVWAVSAYPIPEPPGVHAVYAPRWLTRVCGQAAARLLMMAWLALRLRPDVIGGFHLLINGLAAGLLARLVGARAFYVSVGGPTDCVDGGLHGENAVFRRIVRADAVIERRLLSAIGRFDAVVTMGRKAAAFYRGRGLADVFHVIPGAIDAARFSPGSVVKEFDLILVGRLVEVKRIDVFLEAVGIAAKRRGTLSAVVVGDGPLRASLQERAEALGLADRVRFVGQQAAVEDWYRRSRVFVLTSDSEGLSLAMLEAMACGLPVVVSDVGDLGDMVERGVTGELVSRRDVGAFADAFVDVLSDERRWRGMSEAAQSLARRATVEASTPRWEKVICGSVER